MLCGFRRTDGPGSGGWHWSLTDDPIGGKRHSSLTVSCRFRHDRRSGSGPMALPMHHTVCLLVDGQSGSGRSGLPRTVLCMFRQTDGLDRLYSSGLIARPRLLAHRAMHVWVDGRSDSGWLGLFTRRWTVWFGEDAMARTALRCAVQVLGWMAWMGWLAHRAVWV